MGKAQQARLSEREIEARLDRLGQAVAQAQEATPEQRNQLAAVRERLLAPAREPSRSSSALRRPRLLLSGAVALASAAAVLLLVLWSAEEPLTFTVGDSPGEVGRWFAPRGSSALRVQFSDGSHLWLRPGSGARVRHLDHRGARLLLEHGSADVAVVPRSKARWELEAGPFRVEVLGTKFKMAWHPEDSRFELALGRGRVRLAGPVLGKRQLKPGESVRVWVAARRMELQVGKRARRARARRPAPAAQPRPVVKRQFEAKPQAQKKTQAQKPRRRPSGYQVLVRRGQYEAALEAARRMGWKTVLRREPARSLLALGDAARLAGAPDQAQEVYEAVRRRFRRTRAAARAAFALGRVSFDARRDHADAARWFSTYLRERPRGPLAREALGRLIEASRLGGDLGRARKASKTYMKRFPTGPHAPLARSLLQSVQEEP
jgi:ferric-dicitrate binding protein FerR (iron transport regulator)